MDREFIVKAITLLVEIMDLMDVADPDAVRGVRGSPILKAEIGLVKLEAEVKF